MKYLIGLILGLSISSLAVAADTNGCGAEGSDFKPPNNPSGADFTSACNKHDICYGTCGSVKSECDSQFRKDMITACYDRSQTLSPVHQERFYPGCAQGVEAYYAAVALSAEGDRAFRAAQTKSCTANGSAKDNSSDKERKKKSVENKEKEWVVAFQNAVSDIKSARLSCGYHPDVANDLYRFDRKGNSLPKNTKVHSGLVEDYRRSVISASQQGIKNYQDDPLTVQTEQCVINYANSANW